MTDSVLQQTGMQTPVPRVVHVIRSALTGGVETHVTLVCERLARSGVPPVVVSLANVTPNSQFATAGARVVCLGDDMGWSWRTLRAIAELRNYLRAEKPDVVHLHGARPIFVGGLAARAAGVTAVISSLHGACDLMAMRSDGVITTPRRLLAQAVHGLGFAFSKRIVVCASRLKDDVQRSLRTVGMRAKHIAKSRLRVVYHGIDIERFGRPGAAPHSLRDGVDADTCLIGTLSRLDEPKKGIAVLLKAVALLQEQRIPVALRIAGDGYSRRDLEAQANKLGLANCRFLGFVDDQRDFYRSLDLFVLPSFSEGMPLVNLEAMMSGTAVITTDVGGAAEAVLDRRTGLVVPPGDEKALALAISLLAQNPELRARFAAAGRDRVRNEFSIDVMFKRLLAVYDEARDKEKL